MILVFGSINVDMVVPVPRLPRPGETMLGGDYAILAGGKGANQAFAARRAGAAAMMAGAVGNDDFAGVALAGLQREGIDLSLLQRSDRPTGCASIMVGADGENLIAVASGANATVSAAGIPDSVLGPQTLLVCQMEVPVAENAALIRCARLRGARVVLNLAPALPIEAGLLSDIDVLVANEGEASSLGDDAERLASRLRQALVVTRGAAGATAYLATGGRIDVPALPIEPIDTTGAGDTFVGVLAAALDGRSALGDALHRASAAAGLSRGAQTGMPDAAAIDAAVARLRR
jgi:ribokinase